MPARWSPWLGGVWVAGTGLASTASQRLPARLCCGWWGPHCGRWAGTRATQGSPEQPRPPAQAQGPAPLGLLPELDSLPLGVLDTKDHAQLCW